MKIVYIAHPIKGDVDTNLAKIHAIVQNINLNMPDVVPFAPYLANGLNDNIPSERERGIKNNIEIISRGFIDEMWFYGPAISEGMRQELELCWVHNIVPLAKDQRLADQLNMLVQNHYASRIRLVNTYTIIFTQLDGTTVEVDIFGQNDVHAAQVATRMLAIHGYADWRFADDAITILGTL